MIDPESRAFMEAMVKLVPDGAALAVAYVNGDPKKAAKRQWTAEQFDWSNIDEHSNAYACVSAMKVIEGQGFNRQTVNFAAGLCLMIDDLGSGLGAKFPLDTIRGLPPTVLIETSPDNYQAVYLFPKPLLEEWKLDRLIKGFIANKFLNKDSGMAGVNRYMRLPLGFNGKQKYRDPDTGRYHRVSIKAMNLDNRPTPEAISHFFKIRMGAPPAPVTALRAPNSPQTQMRHTMFAVTFAHMVKGGLIEKRRIPTAALKALLDELERPYREGSDEIVDYQLVQNVMRVAQDAATRRGDGSEWIPAVCPWEDTHSGDNAAERRSGAALGLPNNISVNGNQEIGAFRCFHGSHSERRFKRFRKPDEEPNQTTPGFIDLIDHLSAHGCFETLNERTLAAQIDRMMAVNANPPKFEEIRGVL